MSIRLKDVYMMYSIMALFSYESGFVRRKEGVNLRPEDEFDLKKASPLEYPNSSSTKLLSEEYFFTQEITSDLMLLTTGRAVTIDRDLTSNCFDAGHPPDFA
jgi:hypothetical protein